MPKLRVLVIDDSAYNRQTLAEILNSHPEIEVVGKAYDGEEGLKLVAQLQPDLVTLDIEMPRMDGFTFLRLMMSKMPTPVIVISSHSRKQEVFQCLELGALDFIAKPTHHIAPDLAELRDQLLSKVLTVKALERVPFRERTSAGAARATGTSQRAQESAPKSGGTSEWSSPQPASKVERIVCIGASTGGPPALESLFKAMGPSRNTAFMVSQHMPAKFTRAFAERLNRMAGLTIQEAEEGMVLGGANVYIAPGGRHMELGKRGDELVVRLVESRENDRYVPSIDRMFESVAKAYGGNPILAAVLTGMGADGSIGIRAIRAAGGKTVAESQESSIVFGMPKEAIQTGCIDDVLPLGSIIERIFQFAGADTDRSRGGR